MSLNLSKEVATGEPTSDDVILRVRDLRRYFPIKSGFLGSTTSYSKVLDGISFDVQRREILGLAGESGSGKTVLLRTILRLIEPTGGSVEFEGRDLARMSNQELRLARRQMQMIFQDPVGSLHPRMTIQQTLEEPFKIHGIGDKAEREEKVRNLLSLVGLNPDFKVRYPHQFSGGQRQRIGVARALALNPKLILADEPVSALDVSLQAQVLNLFLDLQEEFQLTYVFVAHDLAVLRQICDRIAIIYRGRLVELATADAIYENPVHPYTRALLASSPSIEAGLREDGVERIAKVAELDAEAASADIPDMVEVEPGHLVSLAHAARAAV